MMWHDMWGWGWGGFLGGLLMMVLFWGAIIALAVWAVRQFRPGTGTRTADGPLRILEERYARGEIDEDEFRRRRETLLGDRV